MVCARKEEGLGFQSFSRVGGTISTDGLSLPHPTPSPSPSPGLAPHLPTSGQQQGNESLQCQAPGLPQGTKAPGQIHPLQAPVAP